VPRPPGTVHHRNSCTITNQTRLVLTMSTKLTLLAALFCFSGVIALAQQAAGNNQPPDQLKGDVPGSSALHVKIEGESIRLEGYSGDRISYQVRSLPSRILNRKQPDVPLYKVAAYVRGGASWLVATPQKDQSGARAIELVVRVPRSLPFVALNTTGGDVTVRGVDGRLEVTTGGGRLLITDVRGVVSAETGGQDIDVGTVDGDGRFHTGGGRIAVDYIKGNLDAFTGGGTIYLGTGLRNAVLESGAGDVRVTFCGGTLKAQSGGGNLVLGDVAGPADIRTDGGNLRLRSAKGFVRAHTGAGNIELDGVPGADASTGAGAITAKFTTSDHPRHDSVLETPTGDITIFLPADLPMTIRATVGLGAGHTINSEIPGLAIASEGHDLNSSVFAGGKLNGGGPVLDVHAGNGNIIFRKFDR
jgi:hypothetical protein